MLGCPGGRIAAVLPTENNVIIIIMIINFIYNAPVPVLQKRAPSTVQLHISGSIHSYEIHALIFFFFFFSFFKYLVNTVASDIAEVLQQQVNVVLNVHRNHKAYQGRGEEGGREYGGRGRGRLYIYISLHCLGLRRPGPI